MAAFLREDHSWDGTFGRTRKHRLKRAQALSFDQLFVAEPRQERSTNVAVPPQLRKRIV